ncbi:MAG TPA: class I SAM-dependent methyltransferase [Pseudonocardiaceae bacterium]|nr:class I SAM-dependent methyltransferase [Pseudonocardiaceae bacterium]
MPGDYHRRTHWNWVHDRDEPDAPGGGSAAVIGSVADALGPRTGGGILLDVGCGSGAFIRELRGQWTGIGADFSERALGRAATLSGGAAWICADAHRLPIATGSVAAITCLSTLWTFAEPQRVLAEAARVLRADGRLIVHLWSSARQCRLVSLGAVAIGTVVPAARLDDGAIGPFELTPERVTGELRAAGLRVDSWVDGSYHCSINGIAEYWAEFAELAPTAYHLYQEAGPARRRKVDAVLDRLLQAADPSQLGLKWTIGIARPGA